LACAPARLGQLVLVEPRDAAIATEQRLNPLWHNELSGTRAVLTDMPQQANGFPADTW